MKILEYKNWYGNRKEFNELLMKIESSFPELFMLRKKTTGENIPIQDARIRNFLAKNLIPIGDYPESRSTKGVTYGSRHLFWYLATIRLRKMKYSDEQIPSILQEFEEEDFIRLIDKGELPNSRSGQIDRLKSVPAREKRAAILKKLGREEGKALLSEQHLIAVLPWLHLHVSKKNLAKLGDEDIEIVTETIKENLLNLKRAK